MKGLAALILLVAASFSVAGSVSVVGAYPSDVDGNAVQVKLGEPFFMTATLDVQGELNGQYQVRFALPYSVRTSPALQDTGEVHVTWGPYTALVEGPLPMTISVESATDQVAASQTVTLVPATPGSAIEYFDPHTLAGRLGASASLVSGSVSGLQWYAPIPTTAGFQRVLSLAGHGTTTASRPFSQPVFVDPKTLSTELRFTTVASAVRCNSALLRASGFRSYASVPSSISAWLRPETLVESRSSEIRAFVSQSLPANYHQTMAPYDAVRELFRAVVRRLQYVDTPARPDALIALRSRQGSCAHFSSLFVACCRSIGIPARAVCGMTAGESAWHVWAEFWVPGQGWVPVDPTYCDTLSPDGALPLFFGVIPDLNERVATTYGFDHVLGSVSIPMLQTPAVWAARGTQLGEITAASSVSRAPMQ